MYNSYISYINYILLNDSISNFKSNPNYTPILEHVSETAGIEYLNYIEQTSIPKDMILKFCELNDKIGNPIKSKIKYLYTSPTNLRYILHAHLILTHIKSLNLNNLNIVEVGGGYGGLCLAIYYFSKFYNVSIEKYNIIDLNSVIKLQKKYLTTLEFENINNVNFIDSNTFGGTIDKENLFLISNYCFSELSYALQKKYIEILFPKVSHGFMAWNFIPLYNFGFEEIRFQIEYPNTSGNENNKYVYF
jgi:hypothetical protein